MKTAQELVQAALTTATQAPTTKELVIDTQAWARWANFSLSHNQADRLKLELMVDAMARFILDMKAEAEPRFLTFLGDSGTGKTMLARRIWKWVWDCGRFYKDGSSATLTRRCQWCDWRDFADECLDRDFSSSHDLRTDWFVVLDDIAARRDNSGFLTDQLDGILSSRSEKLWTVITANFPMEQIATRLDVRIASRLCRRGSVVIDVGGLPDYALA
jgi:DNA replication protein DnaC